MTAPLPERHLSREALADYLNGAPATVLIPGAPACYVRFEPPRLEMSLRTPYIGEPEPDLSGFEYVDARLVDDGGSRWMELLVRYGDSGYEAYLLLSDVADMVQQYGIPFGTAVRSALATFEDLLSRAGSLSAERQTGLYGELLFLESCVQQLEAPAAVEAWKGFAPNEHDYVFSDVCFEVKTTKTERRRHVVNGLQQLEPTPGTSLWLVSIQLTSATKSSGRSLAQLVDDVRTLAGSERELFEISLQLAGWRERDRALYGTYLKLRSLPAAYPVDESFPVLNRRALERGCARSELIVDARYTIDVSSLPSGVPPFPARRFVKEEAHADLG